MSSNSNIKYGWIAVLLFCIMMLLFTALLTGCATSKRCAKKWGGNKQVERKDSIVYETVYEDTTIVLPGDTTKVVVEQPCDSNGILKAFKYRLNTAKKRSTAIVQSRDNRLEVECLCEEERAEITRLREKITEKHFNQVKETVTLKERYIPWFARLKWFVVFIIASYVAGTIKLHKLILQLLMKLVKPI